MSLIKSFIIAFSMYSKIPVPQFAWEEKDMRYVLIFFPWIGAVIGLLFYGWFAFCFHFGIGTICRTLVGAAISLLISGGIHVDGYMDTMDAFHSYQSKERKLEILKDPHIGAFSVIMLILYYLIYIGVVSEVQSQQGILMIAIGFLIARCLSGIGVVTLQLAKKDGLLYTFAEGAERKTVLVWLLIQLGLGVAAIRLFAGWKGAVVVCAAGLTFFYFRWRSYRELGGITGDTAGWFVTLCEGMIAVVVAVLSFL